MKFCDKHSLKPAWFRYIKWIEIDLGACDTARILFILGKGVLEQAY